MLHRSRNNPQSWRCSCICVWRFLDCTYCDRFRWVQQQKLNRIRHKKSVRNIFFHFFHIFPIAKWFGSQVSGIVVQFLLRSSIWKLFSQKVWQFTDKNHNSTVWATGPMVWVGSFHNLFFRLNCHPYSMGSNPIDAVINLFQPEFITFCSFSRQVVEFS